MSCDNGNAGDRDRLASDGCREAAFVEGVIFLVVSRELKLHNVGVRVGGDIARERVIICACDAYIVAGKRSVSEMEQ